MKIIECVPNISEGNDKNIIDDIVGTITQDSILSLLDVDSGKDTNRTVITFVGPPDNVINGAYRLIKKASELIDMSKHKGEHPRMGSTDVCPLIPIQNVSMSECIKLSNILAKKISNDLNIPIYMYENSAIIKERRNLSNIRSGEYEGFENKIKDIKWKPDYGLSQFNVKNGCTAIGAREFLIAYNINLNTSDKKIATDIALDIREKGRFKRDSNGNILRDKNGKGLRKPGIFKNCKAVGWYIEEYKQAQVSINLTNYIKTPIYKVFEEVRKQARKRGVRVTGSEIVGLLPSNALYNCGLYYLKKQKNPTGISKNRIYDIAIKSLGLNDISNFNYKKKIVEMKINNDDSFSSLSIDSFLDSVSLSTPTPGGGSVAALSGAISASLGSMVCNLSHNTKGFEKKRNYLNSKSLKCQEYLSNLCKYIDEDSKSYDNVLRAIRLPKKNKQDAKIRNTEIYKANVKASSIPLEVLSLTSKLFSIIYDISQNCNINSISDIGVAAEMLNACAKGAIYNIKINIKELNKNKKIYFNNKIDYYSKINDDYYLKIVNIVYKNI